MGINRPSLRGARSRWPVLVGISVAATALSFGLPPASLTVLLAQTTPTAEPAPSSSWSIIPSPNVASSRSDDLTSVSCTQGLACMAVGHFFGPGEKTLAESWDGSAWSVVPTPNAGDTTNALISNVLNAVSCTSAQACTAVGEYVALGGWRTLIESWDGSAWSIVPSPNASTAQQNYLDGVSCLSATFCTAVGSLNSGQADDTLVERWDGSAWSIVSSPDAGYINDLLRVSCNSPSACTAVGDTRPHFGFDRTLIESWDGSAWTIVASPDASTSTNVLNDVSCPAPAQCVAVGTFFNGSEYQLLSMSWDGTSWTLLPNPGLHADGTGVTCASATDCIEVGASGLVNSWDGTSWTPVATPTVPGPTHRLNAISCALGSVCMAVGDYTEGTVVQTLVEQACGMGGPAAESRGRLRAAASYTGQLRTNAAAAGAVCGLGIDWAMSERLSPELIEDAGGPWGLLPKSYVDPRLWRVRLFLTEDGRPACPDGYTFDWTISGVGISEGFPDKGCSVEVTVPKLGVYDVKAREFKGDLATGKVIENNHVVVQDWLIVGLGDSNGSGEGILPFFFEQCDRSLASYQYKTAEYVQDQNPHASVTFVFASCSGARTEHLWELDFAGTRPSDGGPLPPQINQVESVIGNRRVNAVIMSVGINDLYFGPMMQFCTITKEPCQSVAVSISTAAGSLDRSYKADPRSKETLADATSTAVARLGGYYSVLQRHLASALRPEHIFITDYPNNATDQTGAVCSQSEGPFPHLAHSTWEWLNQTGASLNDAVNTTSSLGWTPITGIANQFIDHGYCSTSSYFVTIARAVTNLDIAGPFHAKPAGQDITFGQTKVAVCQALYGNPACGGDPPPS